ncbi:MAG: hypothetical protein EOP49_18420 [Sphingobacteriales bacterium]|nr:MAG: hypothetical protein EOP49_18420 [Sphingobacteriales bacterium]
MPLKKRIIFLLALLLSAGSNEATAQFQPYEHPNVAVYRLTPVMQLLEGLNNVLYANYGYPAYQVWNERTQHFEGDLHSYLCYPQITASGNRIMEVTAVDREGRDIPDHRDPRWLTEMTERIISSQKRTKTLYTFGAGGWLQAVFSESLSPESEGYTISRDQFYYLRFPDSTSSIRWDHNSFSSGSGYAGSIWCPPMPEFHTIRQYTRHTLSLDASRNVVSTETYRRDKWQNCDNNTPVTYYTSAERDKWGRVTYFTDSSTEYNSVVSEMTYDWTSSALDAFRQSVKAMPQYGNLIEGPVAAYLASEGAAEYAGLNMERRTYLRYDEKKGTQVADRSNPQISFDSAFFILDRKKERLAAWHDKATEYDHPDMFHIYNRKLVDSAHAQLRGTQFIPFGEPAADVPSGGIQGYRIDTLLDKDLMICRFSLLRAFYTDGNPSPAFDPHFRYGADYTVKAILVANGQGLPLYLWTDSKIYKMQYRKDE